MKNDGRFTAKLTTGLTIAVMGGLLAACSGSNGGFNDPIEDAVGDPLVMMGLRVDPNKKEIEYGPRSPLVMPAPNAAGDLPPPIASTDNYGAQWPQDPDELRKQQEEELRKAAQKEKVRDVEYASKAMSPEELDQWGRNYGRTNGAGVVIQPHGGKDEIKTVSPRELLDRRKDTSSLRSEPPRTSLNEPPPGYRTPAPPAEGEAPPPEKKSLFQKLFGKSS